MYKTGDRCRKTGGGGSSVRGEWAPNDFNRKTGQTAVVRCRAPVPVARGGGGGGGEESVLGRDDV